MSLTIIVSSGVVTDEPITGIVTGWPTETRVRSFPAGQVTIVFTLIYLITAIPFVALYAYSRIQRIPLYERPRLLALFLTYTVAICYGFAPGTMVLLWFVLFAAWVASEVWLCFKLRASASSAAPSISVPLQDMSRTSPETEQV